MKYVYLKYTDSIEKQAYDARDLARLQSEDAYTLRFIYHQQFDIKKAAAQVDASLKFRKEFGVNGWFFLANLFDTRLFCFETNFSLNDSAKFPRGSAIVPKSLSLQWAHPDQALSIPGNNILAAPVHVKAEQTILINKSIKNLKKKQI